MDRKDIVKIIAVELKKIAPEAEVTLFGSEARGEARTDSDIDLLILLPDYKEDKQYIARRSHISGHLYEMSLNLGVDISPLILPHSIWTSRKTPFSVNVKNEGIRI